MRNMVQTTSPSYLLMSSLDRALYVATKIGYQRHMERVEALRARIGRINGLRVLDRDNLGYGAVDMDLTRVVIDVTERGIDGPQAYECLVNSGIVCEMCDAYRVVLITTPQDPDEWYDRLIDGLTHLPYGMSRLHKEPPYIAMGRQVCSLGEAMLGPTERIPLAGAVGRVAAVAAGVYPPGLACLVPGEEIQGDAAAYLLQQQAKGFALFGVEEGRISCIKED